MKDSSSRFVIVLLISDSLRSDPEPVPTLSEVRLRSMIFYICHAALSPYLLFIF